MWQSFVQWSAGQVRQTMTWTQLDRHLSNYLEELYLEGEDLSRANYVTAAVIFHVPGTKGLAALPRAQQAMKGWRKLCPPRSRMPIPYEAICLVANKAMDLGQHEIALVLMMTFLLYLRPGEAFSLRVRDLVLPLRRSGKAFKDHAILLHPLEVGVPSKTKQWDEMLTLDLPHLKFLGPALERWMQVQHRSKDEPLFQTTLQETNQFLEDQWKPLGLQPLGAPHMYRLRHGGASFEAANQLREISGIQTRGRWLTQKSMKNYEKGGRLQQLFGSLSKRTQKEALQAAKDVVRRLLKKH